MAERIGVICVGHLGQHHARVYTELLDARLIGVADSDIERARLIGEHLGVPWYSSAEELIKRKSPDAVSIVVPTSQHYEIAKIALNAGIHVLVEKPSTTSANDSRHLVECARKKGLSLHENYMFIFHDQIKAIDAMVKSGKIRAVQLHSVHV